MNAHLAHLLRFFNFDVFNFGKFGNKLWISAASQTVNCERLFDAVRNHCLLPVQLPRINHQRRFRTRSSYIKRGCCWRTDFLVRFSVSMLFVLEASEESDCRLFGADLRGGQVPRSRFGREVFFFIHLLSSLDRCFAFLAGRERKREREQKGRSSADANGESKLDNRCPAFKHTSRHSTVESLLRPYFEAIMTFTSHE